MEEKNKKNEILIALIFVFIGVVFRLLPHPVNFSPIAAMAMFSGFYFSKRIAFILPIITIFISDIFIGFYDIRLMLTVYISFSLCTALGIWLKKQKKWQVTMGCCFANSFIFYILTNFAVWFFSSWYPKNLLGLIYCYFMALPFFKNSLLGDLFFTGLFFGGYEILIILVAQNLIVNHFLSIILSDGNKIKKQADYEK